jgi:hypothetical protein
MTRRPGTRSGQRLQPAWILPPLLLAVLVLVQHANVLKLPLFADDYLFLDRVRFVDLRTALELPDALGNFYRPLSRQVYFWIIGHVFAESALACHVVNLLLLWGILVMLYALVARRAGTRAGLVAALLVAVNYAWDVPALWGSGTQDLLAVAFALLALHLSERGRHWAGAVSYGLALASKEVVVLLPILVVLLAWRRDRTLRETVAQAIPYGLVALAWGSVWAIHMASSPGAPSPGANLGSKTLAAFAHFPQVALGLEWGVGTPPDAAQLVIALACASIGIVALHTYPRSKAEGGQPSGLPLTLVGTAWVVVGILPIVLMAHFWSAYYYVFALCGAGVFFGDVLRTRSRMAVTLIYLLVLTGSARARQLEMIEVPVSEWTGQSHISEAYVRRSERIIRGLDASLRRALPRPPARSTFFFAGVPGSIAWQVADGPYVRWAYRDSSLRSYYLSEITDDRIGRGPVFLFVARGDTLLDVSGRPNLTLGTAARAVLQDDLPVARGALRYHVGQWPEDVIARYLFAWVAYAEGDRALAQTLLGSCGIATNRPGIARPFVASARSLLVAGDTASARARLAEAIAHDPFDPEPHALFADVSFVVPQFRNRSLFEAYAARELAPDDPLAWRRWGWMQTSFGEEIGAFHSFDRYRQLAPDGARTDSVVTRLMQQLRRQSREAAQGGQVHFR